MLVIFSCQSKIMQLLQSKIMQLLEKRMSSILFSNTCQYFVLLRISF